MNEQERIEAAGQEELEELLSSDEMQNMYLTFTVGPESYGIEIRHVIQIISIAQEITEMPEMPPEMKGFINLRGIIIPVFNLRIRFGKPEGEPDDRNCIIVVSVNDKQIGLIVDGIKEAITIDPARISDPSEMGQNRAKGFISGIARTGEENVEILIDLAELFAEASI